MYRYLELYYAFLKQRLKILLEYRVNFLIGALSTLLSQAASVTVIWIVMMHVPHISGWSYNEILLIYGLITIAKGVNHMFADNLWTLGRHYILNGTFDRLMVRPVNPLFHLLADRFCQDGVGTFVIGILIVIKSTFSLDFDWTLIRIIYISISVLSGSIIFFSLNLITSVSAFWIVDSVPITRIVFETHEFAKYPLDIYGKNVGLIFTLLLPYAFVSFYPAAYLLGRDVGMLAWGGPIVAGVLFCLGYYLWIFGLKHYTSTGS
jgi:ABC-2 type transport system permease protein